MHLPQQLLMHLLISPTRKKKYFEDVEYDKITILEARVRAIEGYDPIQATEMYMVSNAVVPKKLCVLELINYIGVQCPYVFSNHFILYLDYNLYCKILTRY